jgi:hypothetical protein
MPMVSLLWGNVRPEILAKKLSQGPALSAIPIGHRMAEGCKLGFNSIILFEKSRIFKTMIEFNEIPRFSQFRQTTSSCFRDIILEPWNPHKSDVSLSSKVW